MLIGTECVQISKQQVREHILPILDTLFHAQVALAAKDRESKKIAAKNGLDYKSLCYWDARERFDPFVEYVASIVVDLTIGWFWPEERGMDWNGKDGDEPDIDIISTGEHAVPCGFAMFYHREIMTKILGHVDNVREYYESTPLESTWMQFDREIRGSVAAYKKLVDGGERYSYGLVKTKKTEKIKKTEKGEKK